jgi:hypothetical protein
MRRHFTDVRAGEPVFYSGVLFRVTSSGISWPGGHGCRVDGCFRDGLGCKENGAPQTTHAVASFRAEAVDVPEDRDANGLHPFIRRPGDAWPFQIRGDLAWLTFNDSENRWEWLGLS